MSKSEYEMDEEEICLCSSPGSEYFDEVIGHIEDIVVEDIFQNLQKEFFENNWQIFEDNEENKLEYMDIFEKYTNTVEGYIVAELSRRMENFDMEAFARELHENKSILDGEIFDLLISLSDFLTFKEMILDFKAEKDGRNDLNFDITVTKMSQLHK